MESRWPLFAIVLPLATAHADTAQPKQPAFDKTAVAWQSEQKLFADGLRSAEKFRRELFSSDKSGRSQAVLVVAAILRFQKRSSAPLEGRPNLENFRLTADDLLAQIRGRDKLSGPAAFGPFEGRWYGLWQEMPVDHHWHRVVARGGWIGDGDDAGSVESYQYAWVGDGFGWNYVVTPQRSQGGAVILGMVYHLVPHRPKEIKYRVPHVGYSAGPGRLIWITPESVFFEEVLMSDEGPPQRYAITGFQYELAAESLMITEGFQAIYTRQHDDRPQWRRIPVTLQAR